MVPLHAGIVAVGRGGGVFVDLGVLQFVYDAVVDGRALTGEAVILSLGKERFDFAVDFVRENDVADKGEVPSVVSQKGDDVGAVLDPIRGEVALLVRVELLNEVRGTLAGDREARTDEGAVVRRSAG